MTYLQFLLVVHVLGAVIGFGSTFAFAFFPQDGDRLERVGVRGEEREGEGRAEPDHGPEHVHDEQELQVGHAVLPSNGSEREVPPPAPANRVGGARILAAVAVLGGEPAVPCTRNPLQRG